MKIAIINPVSSGVDLISALQDLGAVTFPIFENRMNKTPQDGFIHEDISKTIDYIRKNEISYVVSGSEFGIALADTLSESLNFPHNDLDKLVSRTDKFEMNAELSRNNIPSTKSWIIKDKEDLIRFNQKDIKYPLFIKPTSSAGSDGCKQCNSFNELSLAFYDIYGRDSLLKTKIQNIVVQEFVDGEQYIVNSVSLNGNHLISEIYKVKLDNVQGIPIYRSIVSLSSNEDNKMIEILSSYTKLCLKALGIKTGAAHTEIRMTVSGPILIEVNSRLMGPVLDVNAYYSSFGYSQATLLAESIINPQLFSKRFSNKNLNPKKHFAMIFLRFNKKGAILHRAGLDYIRRLEGFHSIRNIPEIGFEAKNPLLTTGEFGIAYFCHEDKVVLENSLLILHQIEDENLLYGVRNE